MNASTKQSFALKLPLLALLAAGCASQKTVKEYQDELRALREERTQLKKENRDLRMQNESYEVQLADANARFQAPAPVPDNSELDKVGVDYGTDRFGNFYVSVPASITFASGKADLTKQGKEALKVVAQTLKRDHAEGNYWIEGHTDTDPISKSSWGSNRELSSARAMAVLTFLVEECEVPDERCVIVGHGQYDPIANGNDAGAKARNRRVEIVVRKNQ
jgi:chemotaxis protein MotB